MAKRFPRSAVALGGMLVGLTAMAFAVATPGWSVDDSLAAPAVYRIALHSVDAVAIDPAASAAVTTALHPFASVR